VSRPGAFWQVRGAVLALAWGGTVLGHLLSYVVAYPGQQGRAGHLAATGPWC
jgi:hypothetical protein